MARTMELPIGLKELVEAAASAIDSIKVNGVSTEHRRGRPLRVKRRRLGSEQITTVANIFFRLAKAPIRVWSDPAEWQRWEIECFHLLNGDRFRAFADGPRTVCTDQLPGKNLRKLAAAGHLDRKALEAAAREVCRAHRLHSDRLGGPWSHGDLHMGNVLYDAKTDRAQLIDFEVRHHRSYSAVARQSDDILVFLLDLAGRVGAREWLPCALCFLETCARPRVMARLPSLLVVPRGVPGLWWKIRSNYLPRRTLVRRIKALKRALEARANGNHRRLSLRERRRAAQASATRCVSGKLSRAGV